MKRTCYIYQNNKDVPKDKTDAFAIEDFSGFGSVHRAAQINKDIFLDEFNQRYIKSLSYKGYEISWGSYDILFYRFSLPFTEIERLWETIKHYDEVFLHRVSDRYSFVLENLCYQKKLIILGKASPANGLKKFLLNLAALPLAVIAVLYFSVFKKKIAVWTIDMILKGCDCDFRFNHLYINLRKHNLKFVELVRLHSIPNIIKNLLIRKRLVIYYEPIIYFLSMLLPKKKYAPQSLYNSVLLSYDLNHRIILKAIPIFQFIYRLIGIKSFWSLYFSSRNAPLVIAAKASGIKTVGMQHGASKMFYDVFEFAPAYRSEKKLGPDAFGVWSQWYLEYFRENSKIFAPESIKYAGLLRPYNLKPESYSQSNLQDKEIKVLLLSEPLTNPKEVIPYLKPLIADPRFSLAIKVRPTINDLFYENLIKLLPEAKLWPKYDGNIFEDGKKADVFLGSYTTALLEASLIGKLSIFLKTQKWEDCFGVNDLVQEMDILADSPEKLAEHIISRIQREPELKTIEKIKNRYFGENKDGTLWAVKELIS